RALGRRGTAGGPARHALPRGLLHSVSLGRAQRRLRGGAARAVPPGGGTVGATTGRAARRQQRRGVEGPQVRVRRGAAGRLPVRRIAGRGSARREARGERAGDSVSYNASWTATCDTTIATLGIGYADGLRRSLGRSGEARVLLGGRPCPIIGLVTMDLTMVDVGDGPAAVGDVATLVGSAP